jgi:hypothetical protein
MGITTSVRGRPRPSGTQIRTLFGNCAETCEFYAWVAGGYGRTHQLLRTGVLYSGLVVKAQLGTGYTCPSFTSYTALPYLKPDGTGTTKSWYATGTACIHQ